MFRITRLSIQLFIIVVMFIPLSVSVLAQKAALQPGLAMTTTYTPTFAEANNDAGAVSELQPGELLEVLSVDGDWAQIDYNATVAWVQYASEDSALMINVDSALPMPRGYHSMAYDAESDRVIMFEGIHSVERWHWINETWSYDLSSNTWTQMQPEEFPAVGEGPLAYDTQSDRMIFFYGSDENFSNTASETWVYDYNSDTWTNMNPSPAPPPLLGARMVYDSESDHMILFGGLDPLSVATGIVYLHETWAYDYDSNTWTQMQPETSPPGINYFPAAYDASADRMVLIGSNAIDAIDVDITHDTWIYDLNSDVWERRDKEDGPGYRDYGMMVYVESLELSLLFGEGEPTLRNDTWTYEYATNTWVELEPGLSPSERGWHTMVYSTAADKIIMFGGGTGRDGYTLETWTYDPSENTWTQVIPS